MLFSGQCSAVGYKALVLHFVPKRAKLQVLLGKHFLAICEFQRTLGRRG